MASLGASVTRDPTSSGCFFRGSPESSVFEELSSVIKADTLKVCSEEAPLLLWLELDDLSLDIFSLIGPAPSGFESEGTTPYSLECLLECFFSL